MRNKNGTTITHNIDCKPFRFLTWSSSAFFLLQVVSNVFQNDTLRVHADVKSLVPLENVVSCIYLIISSYVLSWFTFSLYRMTSGKGRSLCWRLDLTDKCKRKSMIRTKRSNCGKKSTWKYSLYIYIYTYYCFNCF